MKTARTSVLVFLLAWGSGAQAEDSVKNGGSERPSTPTLAKGAEESPKAKSSKPRLAQAGSASECRRPPNYKGPVVEVTIEEAPVVYDHTLTREQLAERAGPELRAKTGRDEVIEGLTQSGWNFPYTVNYLAAPISGDRYCIWYNEVKVKAVSRKMDVFIDRSYPEGSCRYKEILRHENVHVSINREGLRKYAIILRQELAKAVGVDNPIVVTGAQRRDDQVGDQFLETIEAVQARFLDEIGGKNGAIDTPQSYRESSARCPS